MPGRSSFPFLKLFFRACNTEMPQILPFLSTEGFLPKHYIVHHGSESEKEIDKNVMLKCIVGVRGKIRNNSPDSVQSAAVAKMSPVHFF